ncbi:MAG: response regulator [Ignavibacteriales bacterium UTCHB3]|nr:MAG: response regulator [Ignavibacteriales bacterium UTCHB3]
MEKRNKGTVMYQAAKGLTKFKIKVLLVDDQQIVGSAVSMMLAEEKDIEFHFCQEPMMALTVAEEIEPTVILQDLVMPEIDGLTLVKFFRGHPRLKDVPVIVLSSKEEAITKANAFETGANDYLVKLPDKIELIARIRHHSNGYIALMERNEMYQALLESKEALARELNRAAEYVISLLPAPLKEGVVHSSWKFVPSADLGGDSFGYHWIDKDHFAVYLLDVCDHGVGPALLSVSALNVLRSQTLPNTDFRDPVSVLTTLNETFVMEKQNNLYFTIWYGVFNKETRELVYGSAGHPPALLFEPEGEIKELITKNLIVGHLPKFPYKSARVAVPDGAALYVFSDGVYEVEISPGVMWTLEEMRDFLKLKKDDESSELGALYDHIQVLNRDETLPDDFSILKLIF